MAKMIPAATGFLLFPCVEGALSPVVPILEAVQKMTQNRDDFEDLCESIEIVTMLQEKISRMSRHHELPSTVLLLQEIQQKLGEFEARQKKSLKRRVKEFATSTSVGHELARYRTRLKRLRSNFIQMYLLHHLHLIMLPPDAPLRPAYSTEEKISSRKCMTTTLRMSESDIFTDVFFLDASTIDTIKSGLKNIALTRSIGTEDVDVSRWLASRKAEWLLIFDNADDPSINLAHYFPQSSSGNILITSRNPKLHVHAPDAHHHISDMEEEDAVQLLLASAVESHTTETETLAAEIVKVLHCFPLAVVQAGAFIAQTGKLRNYLTLYKKNRGQLLSRVPAQSHDKYAWSVYTTWDISFKCLGPLAAKFLQICSFLHHDGISETIFSNAATYEPGPLGPTEEQIKEPREFLGNFLTQAGTWDELRFIDITTEIQGYSLIHQDPNTNQLSMHPLVHDWSRNTILGTDSTCKCTAAILAMSVVYQDQVFLIKLLPHINSVLHVNPQVTHKFRYPYQAVYYHSGHFNKAQELCEALLEDRRHTIGSEHPHTLTATLCLAKAYWKLGKFTDAEQLAVPVMEKCKEIFGTNHPATTISMGFLALTYFALGKFSDAEELQVTVLKTREQELGTEHPDTLRGMANLATTYLKLGKITDAAELQVSVLEKMRLILGPEHPHTLASMGNLASTYYHLEKFTQAEELQVSVLQRREQILGWERNRSPMLFVGPENNSIVPKGGQESKPFEPLAINSRNAKKPPDGLNGCIANTLLGAEHPKLSSNVKSCRTYWKLGKFVEAEQLRVTVQEEDNLDIEFRASSYHARRGRGTGGRGARRDRGLRMFLGGIRVEGDKCEVRKKDGQREGGGRGEGGRRRGRWKEGRGREGRELGGWKASSERVCEARKEEGTKAGGRAGGRKSGRDKNGRTRAGRQTGEEGGTGGGGGRMGRGDAWMVQRWMEMETGRMKESRERGGERGGRRVVIGTSPTIELSVAYTLLLLVDASEVRCAGFGRRRLKKRAAESRLPRLAQHFLRRGGVGGGGGSAVQLHSINTCILVITLSHNGK
ncbi:hypothetical protein C8J57DRAFT_1465521 [Mycena rebaudengoi]|nr:hypothetical protein C8J57DRAFT_1465521 [Mycena rebaudengoi]